jgi:hypothetical protein
LELLQNADDNHYDEALVPTLSFNYEPDGLRVDCNELGFQAKHVEAISTVRSSTKSGMNKSEGYTGEKGIGFKSVFRIADEVWISSRQYHFKFDKYQRFGMIAPVWAEFPKPKLPAHTSFFLKLAKDYNHAELTKELVEFEAILLLFLRRILRVELQVFSEQGSEWTKTISKTKTQESGESFTILKVDDKHQRYLTFDHQVDNLPVEPRRPNSSSSILNLAFPVTNLPHKPTSDRQQVFALLPVRDYGLKVRARQTGLVEY